MSAIEICSHSQPFLRHLRSTQELSCARKRLRGILTVVSKTAIYVGAFPRTSGSYIFMVGPIVKLKGL